MMKWGRISLSAVLSIALVACGGGDGSTSTPPISGGGGGGGGGGTPTPTADCSLAARKAWTFQQLDMFYLFPDLLDRSVDPANLSVQEYINRLVAPARAQNRDRGFTYITSIEEERALIERGASAGFGFRLSFNGTQNRLFIAEAFESAPAFQAGIDRGAELVSVNGRNVSELIDAGGYDAVADAFGPSDPGVTRQLGFIDTSGVSRTVSVTKAEYSLDPVSDRYGALILNEDGKMVGYINLRTFIVETAEQDLRTAFSRFRQQGVTEIILDLRYNGGGLVSIAELLGDLLARDQVGKVFSRTVFRPSLSAENSTRVFQSQPQAINVTKLAVIGTTSTASASELVTNSLIPYLGDNLALIGDNTFGKPVGQIAVDRAACDDRLRVLAFKTENANGQGEYYTGLASVVPRSCRANDELSEPLGSAQEDSIETALDFLAGRSCTPITSEASRGTLSVKPRRGLLQSPNPNAAQHRVPGLF